MKRIIIIVLCLCMILTGCQSKKGNNDRNESHITKAPESTEASTNSSSGKDTGKDTVTNLLQLNKAWSLVQTAQLDQADYKAPSYEADVASYRIKKDLSNVENINQFSGFTKKQKEMLVENGFIVLPSSDTRIYYVYDDNEYKGVPNFITADSILHIYHQFYDKTFMGVETNYLYKDLELMTNQMLDKSLLMLQQLKDEDLKALQKKNIVYFLVARMLMLQSTNPGVSADSELMNLAKQEYELIQGAESIKKSPLFGVDIDYTQFKVRGHYTKSKELESYFKTMMWFGTAPLEFVDDTGNINYNNVYQALMITYTTVSDSKTVCDAKLWSDIYQSTSEYVGLSDDINVFTMNGLRTTVFGENENPDSYNDKEYLNKLTEAVKALPEPQIQGKLVTSSLPTGKQFRFMGQRYVLDSDILQTLMEPFKRALPSALDVMGVLGSNTAEDLLFQQYKPQNTWPEYTQQYRALKTEVGGYGTDYWKTNLYSGWLWTIQDGLKEYDKNSGMPYFMTTEAWKKKALNTALSSYTELKHDTVLYGKQAMAEMGGPTITAKLHYVEPDVELYSKLLYLTDFTCSVLEDKGMLNDNLKEGSQSFKDYLRLLIDCSIKELRNEPLTEEENKKLLWSGGTLEKIMMDFLIGTTDDYDAKEVTDMLVTDIASNNGNYLTLGTGYFDYIYVVIPYDGKLYLSRGPVYSFYEFTGTKRLTDEEWWALQGIKVVHEEYDYAEYGKPSKNLPKQPEWIHSFKSDTNQVDIKSLEVLFGNLEE